MGCEIDCYTEKQFQNKTYADFPDKPFCFHVESRYVQTWVCGDGCCDDGETVYNIYYGGEEYGDGFSWQEMFAEAERFFECPAEWGFTIVDKE